MLTFALGIFVGLLICAVIMFRPVLARLGVFTNTLTANTEKLINARKSFGKIATRQSIGEARKIANTALKELEK